MRRYKVLSIIISFLIIFPARSLINKKYQKTITYEYNIDSHGKKLLSINNIDGKLNFIQTEDSVIRINYKTSIRVKKRELNKEITPLKLGVDTVDDKIILKVVEKTSEYNFLNFGKVQKDEYDIFVPINLAIEINSNFSDVYVDNTANDFKINLINGDVIANKPKGNYSVNIINGKFKIDADSVKNINVNITNGKFYLQKASLYFGDFDLNIENGKILNSGISFDSTVKSDKKTLVAKRGKSENKLVVNIVNGRIYLRDNVKVED